MHRLAIVVASALLAALVAASPADAEAYNTILEDGNIRVSLSYPPEVKFRACYTLRFDAQAFKDLQILEIRLTVKLYADGAVQVLHDSFLVSSLSVTGGWVYAKNIGVCIPAQQRPDPFLEGKIRVKYMVGGQENSLLAEWYMSVVREMTYDELLSRLNEARREIREMEKKINHLQVLMDELRSRLESLSKSYSELSSAYRAIKDSHSKLQEEYSSLQDKYEGLLDDYRKLLVDYEKLRSSYSSLMSSYDLLKSNYDSMRRDHNTLLEEYHKLRGIHQTVTENYESIRSRYEDSVNTIGRLEATIKRLEDELRERQRQMNELNMVYTSVVNENTLTKSILYAQTAAIAGLGAGIFIVNLMRKRSGRASAESVQEAASRRAEDTENSKNGKIQRVLSGRRVTIPRDAVEKLGIKEGGKVSIEVHEDHVVIKPIKEEIQGQAN